MRSGRDRVIRRRATPGHGEGPECRRHRRRIWGSGKARRPGASQQGPLGGMPRSRLESPGAGATMGLPAPGVLLMTVPGRVSTCMYGRTVTALPSRSGSLSLTSRPVSRHRRRGGSRPASARKAAKRRGFVGRSPAPTGRGSRSPAGTGGRARECRRTGGTHRWSGSGCGYGRSSWRRGSPGTVQVTGLTGRPGPEFGRRWGSASATVAGPGSAVRTPQRSVPPPLRRPLTLLPPGPTILPPSGLTMLHPGVAVAFLSRRTGRGAESRRFRRSSAFLPPRISRSWMSSVNFHPGLQRT
jgi:hypothetical protein